MFFMLLHTLTLLAAEDTLEHVVIDKVCIHHNLQSLSYRRQSSGALSA